jgi:hypothetical protein
MKKAEFRMKNGGAEGGRGFMDKWIFGLVGKTRQSFPLADARGSVRRLRTNAALPFFSAK